MLPLRTRHNRLTLNIPLKAALTGGLFYFFGIIFRSRTQLKCYLNVNFRLNPRISCHETSPYYYLILTHVLLPDTPDFSIL